MYKAPVTIIMVLDISGSMIPFLDVVAKALGLLNREAYRMRDRLALIAFKEGSAYVLNSPTTNVNVVAGNITKLKASGNTPLADGMMKALEVVTAEKRRNKDIIPLIVVISDFVPNMPLKAPDHTDPIADTLYVAGLLRKSRIPIIVINLPVRRGSASYLSPLARQVAEVTAAKYYQITFSDAFDYERHAERKFSSLLSESITDIDFLTKGPEHTEKTPGFYI
jgi:magnesium chelatase subunit D